MRWDRSLDSRHALLGIVLVGAAVRLYGLGVESLWTDELITLEFVRRYSTVELLVEVPLNQPHLPLYYVLLDLWIGVFGTSATALRLLSALFSILAIPLLYLLGRDLFDGTAGLVAALVFALAQFHVYHAQEVRMYSLVALLTAASLWLFVRLFEDGAMRGTAAAYVLATLALLLTHPFAALVVFAEAAYVVFRVATGQWVPRSLTVGTALAGVGLVPVAAMALHRVGLGGATSTPFPYIPQPTPTIVAEVVLQFFAQTSILLATLFVGVLVVGTLTLGLTDGCVSKSVSRSPRATVRGLRERVSLSSEPGVELLVVLLLATFVLPIVVSFVLFPVFWPRYVLPASLGLYLLVGRGVSRIQRPPLRLMLVALLLVGLVPVTAYDLTTDTHEQWDEATAHIEEEASPGALVIVADQITERGVEHYRTRSDIEVEGVVVAGSGTGREPATDAEIRALMQGHDEVWLVLSHTDSSSDRRLRNLVGAHRDQKAERNFLQIDVYHYERGNQE
ncbi:glycosyltransferase family 39 protein [Halomarina salina]|uniref:Glycosyltransferase family 39 protein n=1 Tax=Halomarina salina TaxID=1872699 RepID=A0ABD5RU47_9EURY|nr:glycosyltransferase family 39 protein [Halomarina salina]